jgi:hypothetical protein
MRLELSRLTFTACLVLVASPSAAAVSTATSPGDWTPSPAQQARLAHGETVVEMLADPGRSSGIIHAAVDVHGSDADLWRLLTDCHEAPGLVPFIKTCRVITRGPNFVLQEEMVQTVFFLPHIRTVFRADYHPLKRIDFHCVPGSELKVCDGAWRIEPTTPGTVRVTYASAISSPYPVPDFVIRIVLSGQMGDAMRNLRRRAADAVTR